MERIGILRKIVRMIQSCIHESNCKVKYKREETEELNVLTEINQDNTMK